MQIGVVGVGWMGRFHARFRSGLAAIDRIVLADATDERAVELAGNHGAESISLPEMVEDVDDVVITSSTSAHPESIMHCVDAGEPSFCVHDFDAIGFVTGQEVLNISADGSVIRFPVFEKYDDIDTGAALLRLESDSLGMLSATRHNPLGYDIRMELHGFGDSVAAGWDDQIPLRSPLALHAAQAGRPRHRSHPRCARANQIHRVVSPRTGCRSGQQTPIGHQPSRGGLVEFAISESKGSDAMDASDTSGVARHRTQEGGKQC